VGSGVNAADLDDVDNRYPWAGRCTISTGVLCQPNAAAAATCAAQTGGELGCGECGGGDGTCDVDPGSFGAITTIWDWVEQVNAEGFAGHSDWRIPTISELNSIVTGFNPSIDPVFGPTQSAPYWSGSTISPGSTNAYYVHFYNGSQSDAHKINPYWIRAVRSAP